MTSCCQHSTRSNGNGTGTLYRFDNQNRLVSQQNTRGAGTPTATILSAFEYTVRADGKRTGVREQVVNPLSSSVTSTTRTVGYDFDKAGRLTKETREERKSLRAGGEQSSTRIAGYDYDEVSNRKKLTTNSYSGIGAAKTLTATSTVDYNYNAADELTDETATVGATATTKTYTYDDNGAQVGITSGSVTTPYKYDFEGKLLSVGDATSSTRSVYSYDGDGNRVSSIVTSGGTTKTTNYLNDTNTDYVQVLEERDENGTLQARYDYGDGDLQRLTRLNTTTSVYQTRWFLNDGLDSTRQLVDDNAAVTDSYAYDAFGNTADRAGDTTNSRLYNGQQQDETGLYFLRARYMNTASGRFLSHDPQMGGADDPITLHRYLYAGNDPVNHVDPSGCDSIMNVSVSQYVSTVSDSRPAAANAIVYRSASAGAQVGQRAAGIIQTTGSSGSGVFPGIYSFASRGAGKALILLGLATYATSQMLFTVPQEFRSPVDSGGSFSSNDSISQYWSNPSELQSHYESHRNDFTETQHGAPLDYARYAYNWLRQAKEASEQAKANNGLVPNSRFDGLEFAKRDWSGETIFYHPASGTFGVQSANGRAVNLYRPGGGYEYWRQQIEPNGVAWEGRVIGGNEVKDLF